MTVRTSPARPLGNMTSNAIAMIARAKIRMIAAAYSGQYSRGKTEMRKLYLALNYEYFDQILAGMKTEEYRLVETWRRRLEGREGYDQIILTKGYPKNGGIEGKTRLTLKWRGFTIKTITHKHFGDVPREVYAIDVTERWAA